MCVHLSVFSATIAEINQTMKRATHFMMDSVSHQGGFVWSYLADQSRCWGEMEATKSMVWIQSPSTPEVGNILLEAYDATSDEYYYQQACKVADVLIRGQHSSGGWNYCFDLNGEESLRNWYATIGKAAWRLEEFQHYYGNATFDDEVTVNVGKFFLKLYLEKKDEKYRKVLDKVIAFVCNSQYENGGWPQRFPLMYDHSFRGKADYSSFVTLNDEVLIKNISFLKECRDKLNLTDLDWRIKKAMYLIPQLQQPKPYAGWSDQYTLDLKPAHARSYEPRAVNTATTMNMMRICRNFFEETGDSVFICRLPDAIDFLKSQKLGNDDVAKWKHKNWDSDAFLVPRFIDPDTGIPLYVHRKGSNVYNGEYYTDQDLANTIGHYSSAAWINPDALYGKNHKRDSRYSDFPVDVEKIISSLDERGYWLSPIRQISNRYKSPDGYNPTAADAVNHDFASTDVGDEYDTSPYSPQTPVMGISTRTYLFNMHQLISALQQQQKPKRFTITNANGMNMDVINYGARIVSLNVPNKKGTTTDVVLGFDSLADYTTIKQNFGAVVGRYISRLRLSDGTLISHGGKPGFANRYFDVVNHTANQITLQYVSFDGESGFNGELTLKVIYTLTDDNSLNISYEATTTKPTVLNISNHSFFNLTLSADQSIDDEILWLAADSVLEYDANKNVTGNILPVKHTSFDFTKKRAIRSGYDHCFKLNPHTLNKSIAKLKDKYTGLAMEVYTTEPGLLIYTANGHKGTIKGKQGLTYNQRNAICFETMHFPDSPNYPQFPSTSLQPDEIFHSTTIFKFK